MKRNDQTLGIPMMGSHEYSWDGFKLFLFKYQRRNDLTVLDDLGIDLSPR